MNVYLCDERGGIMMGSGYLGIMVAKVAGVVGIRVGEVGKD